MNKFQQLLAILLPIEEQVVPIFIHNPKSQTIAGIVIAAESVAAQVAQEIVAAAGMKSPK